MSKKRDYFTQIGITKKDRDEMAGCITAMFFIPIYLLINSIKMLYSIITNVINFIEQRRSIPQEDKDKIYKENKRIIKKQIYHKNKTVFHQIPPIEFRTYKEDNYLILENDYFKLKYYTLTEYDFIFDYKLKWNNGSYFGGGFGINKPTYDKPFNPENYGLYFYNSFELAKQNYQKNFNKNYSYFDSDPFNEKDTD